jgi:hypothetical protein
MASMWEPKTGEHNGVESEYKSTGGYEVRGLNQKLVLSCSHVNKQKSIRIRGPDLRLEASHLV